MRKQTKGNLSIPFAHLLGIGSARAETDKEDEKEKAKHDEWAKKAESNPERKKKDEESDDDYAKRMEKADEDDEKRKKEDGDEEDEEEGDEKAKAVRHSERARCAKIIAHGIKTGCVNQAGVFAFDTSLTAAQAISALSASSLDKPQASDSLAKRMAQSAFPNVNADSPEAIQGADSPQARSKGIADQIIAAAAKARGEVK